jgi:hypothetical protein
MVCPQRSAGLRVDRFEPAVHARRSKPDRGRERAAPRRSPAPIPEWQIPGDPRAKLRIRAPQDPDCDPSGPYPDHLYLYTGGVDSYHYAATRPQQWPPNSVGRYRNTDPVLIS